MKNFSFRSMFAVLILTGTSVYAQQEAIDTAVFGAIRRAELKSSQIPQLAHYLTDVSGPRLTNSAGFKRASNWAVATMKKWGLENVALEPWGEFGKQWEPEEFSIAITAPYPQSVIAYPTPWTVGTKGLKKAKVVVLSSVQLRDSAYVTKHLNEFKGKIILVANSEPSGEPVEEASVERFSDSTLANMKDQYHVTRPMIEFYMKYHKAMDRIAQMLKKSGAIAVIHSEEGHTNGPVLVQANGGQKLDAPETLPQVSMAFDDGQKIARLIKSGHEVEISLNIKSKFSTEDTKGYNVVAEIPGSDPTLKSELVMLGGHLDSWQSSEGATDNAAGCVVMMEVVRLLDSLNIKPKRTVRIALWSGEEQGVFGSYNYVKNHFMNADGTPKPENGKVSAYFNLDNGTGKIRGIFSQNNTAIKPIFEQWFTPFHDLGAKTVTTKNTGSTDHISFDWAGIPGFQFIQDPMDYEARTHHTNLDDYDHLQIDDLKQAAIIVASFVYQASVRPELLPRKAPVKETFVFEGF
ncbi:M20/M25/M40 family metallo-hydrolase [Dyadobacter arcticus]|uniref:Carboxypeptidase Q n=1 Tax=Dyadobacter arcticus TaxID=1078754 RepID=A0ABX0US10_9BACT|nr:M20/M25/M40 family metallo-hydrolase [Dyadobacter arcticus]NIJ54410.1 hypothetical protein [Dyadobacter arcticus]